MLEPKLYGHQVNVQHVKASVRHKSEVITKVLKERNGNDFTPRDDFYLCFASEYNCQSCGLRLEFVWNGKEESAPFIRSGYENQPPESLPLCVPTPSEYKVKFTCKSGRVALGNDFRPYFKNEDRDFDIGNDAGDKRYVERWAEQGYLTGYIGNASCSYLTAAGGKGLDVVTPNHAGHDPKYKNKLTDDWYDRMESKHAKKAVHKFHSELWWFAIVDAADLPEGATDTYGRAIGFFDLEPGEYEMTYYPFHVKTATLRRVK